MKKNFFYLILLSMVGCSTPSYVTDYSAAPSWVNEHPISSHYYIGVGVAKKGRGTDFRASAKKNAYEEISSEISVSISSNSILKQQEENGKFKELFNSSLSTYTNNELKGCEKVGSWENRTEYWEYYRLSKEEVKRHKREVVEDALISLKQAVAYDEQNDYPKAIASYAMVLSIVKPYLGQRLKANFNGETIFIGQYTLNAYRELIASVKLSTNHTNFKYVNFKNTASLTVFLKRGEVALKHIPLQIIAKDFSYSKDFQFNELGEVVLPEVAANTFRNEVEVTLSVDIEQMIDETVSDDLVKELLKSYETTTLKLLYKAEPSTSNNK